MLPMSSRPTAPALVSMRRALGAANTASEPMGSRKISWRTMGPVPRGVASANSPEASRRRSVRWRADDSHTRPSKRSKARPRQRRFGSRKGSLMLSGKRTRITTVWSASISP